MLLAGLPAAIRVEIAALSLKGRDLSRFRPRVVLVHGRDDPVIPESESLALEAALPPAKVDLYFTDSLAHVDLTLSGLADTFTLWGAVYRVLALRDGRP
jgi:hypothetical protein